MDLQSGQYLRQAGLSTPCGLLQKTETASRKGGPAPANEEEGAVQILWN